MPYVFAALVGVVSLAVSLLLALRRLRNAEDRVGVLLARKRVQVERIKRAARTTLQQAGELRAAERRKATAELSCEDLEQRLKASAAIDRRVYVLDDRRTQADLGWVLTVANGDYAAKVNAELDPVAQEGWRRGRRFLVWGLDEKKAREKAAARFPEARGFAVTGVEAYRA